MGGAGAATEAELKSRKEALDDAINATKAAVEEGVVPGGGLALVRVMEAVETVAKEMEGDQRTGLRCLAQALGAPALQIAENSAMDGGVVLTEATMVEVPEDDDKPARQALDTYA